ncbi:MAG: UDP-N-acetylmuramoyl-L-alanyl-D-glutamate--2,6-diaminopimelate ligase [Candidatus Portnoybacteria bacterium]|nr:UDP-N-acetylmuramoyl-L-alanyl-D-glutamate--2,6-diaminopimelate ligase [Candidatus Portnoybacteria bacterium]
MKKLLKKIIPDFLLSWYHFGWAFLGAIIYRFPSKKLKVIGVTGTKGKTTTCNLITDILNYCHLRTGMATTVNFKVGDKEWINQSKQTMQGRFKLQKLLRRMVKQGCRYAVIETSSEGILQHRHRFIDYDVAIFTNLTPEHLERHGNFANYRAAKMKLFKEVAKKENGLGIYNLDDENVKYFLSIPIKKKYGYTIKSPMTSSQFQTDYRLQITDYELFTKGSRFTANNQSFEMPLIGQFNIYNAAAAVCLALSQGIPIDKAREALVKAQAVPGRMEVINQGQDFTVIIDYSYEPASLENVLKTAKIFNPKRIIVLFGSAGGGRDKWRRPVMGQIADKYADLIIVTTDDPYNEEPSAIIEDILKGILKNKQRILDKNVFSIIERRKAIKKALSLAQSNDAVIFAGKGGEIWMNMAQGKKIPWPEKEIVQEELKKLQ